jgi:O-acetylhomoserine/O-acetylserine sulfhydrylase-like pyridoxal-dependent enzyme
MINVDYVKAKAFCHIKDRILKNEIAYQEFFTELTEDIYQRMIGNSKSLVVDVKKIENLAKERLLDKNVLMNNIIEVLKSNGYKADVHWITFSSPMSTILVSWD